MLGFYQSNIQWSFREFKNPRVMHTWQHYCHVFTSGKYAIYIDGDLKYRGQVSSSRLEVTFNGTVVLGQEQDAVGGGFIATEMFRGRMAQYNIWDRPLPHQEIQGMATCSRQHHGNILSSDVHDGDFFNVATEDVSMETFCQDLQQYIIIPANLAFSDAASFCQRTGSVMYTPDSAASNSELHRRGQTFVDSCTYFLWLGVTDEAEEGVWRSLATNDTVETFFERKDANAPNTNCVSMIQVSGMWYPESCTSKSLRCFPCEARPSSFMLLRGLCFPAGYMRSFEILDSKNGTPFFHGLYGYNMYRSPDGTWNLFDSEESQVVAKLPPAPSGLYPIGTHHWQLMRPVCDHPVGSTITTGLSTCEDDQFMCSNGDCISRLSRCDTLDDCVDQSDEEDCGTITIPENYRRHKLPKNNTKGQPLLLVAHIEVLRFVQIKDTQNAVSIEFYTHLYWQDFRITYRNLHRKTSAITKDEMERLWRPILEFSNVMSGQAKFLKAFMTVDKKGEALPPDINQAKMDWVYPSSSGLLHLSSHYTGRFVCVFNMFYYPFDTQRCLLAMHPAATIRDFVGFANISVAYRGEEILASYTVGGFRVHMTSDSTMKVEFLLTRQPMTTVMSVFIPTMMLVAIGYSTLHLDLALMQVRLPVSLTTLLVLYTLFNQTSSSLPKTAYVKLIDVWFFLCICTLFVIILFHVFVQKFDVPVAGNIVHVGGAKPAPRYTSAQRALQIMRSRLVPLLLLVCLVAFWSTMVVGSNRQRNASQGVDGGS
ncbi:uncharacterized protein [Panulirus ornatus]|uniref:uncharacterized protein n=1 Tax=Panulirus ornatus TaxID=150431 RepID=UPI003A848784